jgi:capsule polysaccharide export protein KpsC/LpsZ
MGYGFLVLLFFALLHVLLVRTQTITIYGDYIQIKSVMARKIIQWRDVQTVYFSEKEIEYTFLNSHSPALVLNLKDGTRYLIWCSQKRKAEAVSMLAPPLNLNNGFVTLA